MYIQHFGMIQYPFSLTPNTRYFLKLPSHQKAFDLLLKTLDSDSAFAKVIGEVGTGKTMLCRKVLGALETQKKNYLTAYIPHPVLDAESLMQAIADELEIANSPSISYFDLIKQISECLLQILNSEKNVILLIDEAQAMPEETIEAVNLLTKIESSTGKHLQVILFGQPELNELLEKPALRHIFRKLSFSFELPALNRDSTEAYVAHRLSKAGYNGPHMFSKKALNSLYKGSRGIPRLINILCHKAMLVAYGKGDHSIEEEHIERALADTQATGNSTSWSQRLFAE